MTFPQEDILDIHAALTRAQAMGFEKTAEAMQALLRDMLKSNGAPAETARSRFREMEDHQ